MKSLTFNNIKKPWLYLLQGRYKPPFAPIQRDLIFVKGMDGAYLGNTSLRPLYINQPVGFVVKNDEHALQLKDELAEWLFTNEPVELQFDDEPGRTYYAIVQNTIEDFERFVNLRQGTIQFLCLDPYSYGEEQTIEFQSDSVMVENKGTAETEPIFELTAKQKTTFAMVSNGDDEYNLIGTPADVDEQVVDERIQVLDENGETIDTWQTPPGFTGSFRGSQNGIFVQSYGTGTGWHGPALMKEINPIQDFEIEFLVNARTNRADQTFRISTNFFDENMNELGMLRLWDNSAYQIHKAAEARVGPFVGQHINYPISSRNYNMIGQLVWYGLLRVIRKGNVFTFYVARIDQFGRHVDTITERYVDVSNEYAGKLRYIRFDIAKYSGTETATEVSIDRLRVYQHNTVQVDQTPYIVYPGDVITFDHSTADILLNGEPRNDLKNFGGSFFTLKKGFNSLVILPENTFDTKIKFREKFR